MVLRSIENVVRVEGGKMNGEGRDEEREREAGAWERWQKDGGKRIDGKVDGMVAKGHHREIIR